METQLAKIEPIKFMAPRSTRYHQALASNKSWWSRATDRDIFSFFLPIIGAGIGGLSTLFGILWLIRTGSGWLFGIYLSITLLSLGGMHFNSHRAKKENDKILVDLERRFFFQLASGVEAFNRRATVWNGMLAALELGAEDKMSREEKENMQRMLVTAREELARKVQLAEALMLPSHDHRPQVAAYLEELRDTERELPGRIAVPEKALNQNGFQEVLENEVALFDYVKEPKALPSKES